MTEHEALLVCAMEECNELSQRLSKAARFGIHETQPGHDLDNRQRIIEELTDLVAVLEMSGIYASHVNGAAVDRKIKKVREYMNYSRMLGTVTG